MTTTGVGNYLPHYKLGYLMERLDEFEESAYHYLQTYLANPDYPEVMENLGRVLLKVLSTPLDLREYLLDNIINPNPSHSLKLAKILYSAGDYPGCLLYLEQCNMSIVEVRELRLKSYLAMGRLDQLEIELENQYGDSPGESSFQLGKFLFDNNYILEAADHLLKAMTAGIETGELYYMLSCICCQRNVLWEAEQLIQRAINTEPERQEYHEKMIDILLQQTIETLIAAIDIFPTNNSFKALLSSLRDMNLQGSND
ncbi:hypothetical protein N752_21795 [Desulforamulus aquiferis]|nr:hypothetical protein [Desulforamulus aquiferis]RYD03047.1 hypothetical protein N752_21795 [Desulforamulus aquiferis]